MPDLGAELAALLRAGCSITLTPRHTMYGIVYADVVITPPVRPNLPPATGVARLDTLPLGPIVKRWHVVYEMSSLATWMHQARRMIESGVL